MNTQLVDFSKTVKEEQASAKVDRSPSQQGTVIPAGWKPTAAKPVPVVRCVQIKKDGERCDAWSLRGYSKCYSHSGRGNFTNVTEYANAVVESARLRLVGDTDEAVRTLEELMQPGTADSVRLKAATEILDRAGVRGGFEIDLEVVDSSNPAEALLSRLSKLNANAQAATEILDGEVVEEESDQLELF